ncbi:hypothetical protein [Paenirhodobacter populi]|uniref:Phage tail tape measure protein n=1 Tax=Paenirhodobacter populi TaxID=2306993 RepID=A0A443JDZ3_9RHOB|nr:hypothetical protein [Sinirhodobacter populi]RWR18796.1 hypothetical protein D2T30_15660 [Sinirhodobacter populi]
MADAIGALYVSLGLDSAAFTAGVKQAQTQAKAFAGQVGKIMGGAIAAAAPAMAAIGVAAANMGAEIQRAAQLSNASAVEFQGWSAGAKSVGIEQEKLADILKDVNDRVGDFISTGGGPMKDFFDVIGPKVGVTAEQFRNLSGPQALQLYVDSLKKANVNQQDFTFYMEAMASDSTALLPLLRDGGKGMAEYAAKAASLGAVLDNKTIAAFARAKQSFSDVQMAFSGFRNIIAQQVVPAMTALANAFVEASKEGNIIGDTVRAIAAQIPHMTAYVTAFLAVIGAKWVAAFAAARVATFSLVGALAAMKGAIAATGIGLIAVAIGEITYRVMEWTRSVGGLSAAWYTFKAKFFEVLRDMAGRWVDFTWTIADGMNSLFGTDFAGQSAVITQELGAAQLAAEEQAAAARAAAQAADDAAGGFNRLGGGLDQVSSASDKAKAKLSSLQEVMKRLKEQNAELKATMSMSDVDADVWRNQRDAGVSADSNDGKQIAAITKMNAGMQSLKDATKEWQSSISSAFSSFLTGASSFKDMVGQIIGKLAEMVMNAAFQNMFTQNSGWMGSVLKGFGIGANANGTNNWRGGLTAINERGGEIVDLPSGSRIIPHDVSKRMMDGTGSGGISISVDARGATEGTADLIARKLNEVAPTLIAQSVSAMKMAQKRGA